MQVLSGGLALCVAVWMAFANIPPLAFFALDLRTAQPGHFPEGWRVKVNRGRPEIAVIGEPEGAVLRMRSNRSSYAIERALDVSPDDLPYLTWKWKVTELPRGGDFRRAASDDQAAQVLIAFDDKRVLSYIWDTTAPQGTMQSASNIPFLHIFAVVCRSGPAELNQWLSESRNVASDYEAAYNRKPPHVKGIRLQINTQHTGTSADSYFGEVAFRKSPM